MPRAVILTALSVEYVAVRTHLAELREDTHPNGRICERGNFSAGSLIWDVCIVEIDTGNTGPLWKRKERLLTSAQISFCVFA